MAAPNIINSTTVQGKRAYATFTNSSMANVLINSATSNQLIKVSEISIVNVSGSSIQTNVAVGRGSTIYFAAANISIPASSTLSLVARDNAFYMEEGDYLLGNTSAANGAHIGVSYEVTS
jgi:hypothetical protein